MSKSIIGYLKLKVKGGEAKPAHPVGPALGSKGINIMQFCKQFNARTQHKMGELLPVLITIYQDKSFDFVIKTPPASTAIMTKIGIKKGSAEPNRKKIGTITWEEVEKITTIKMPDLNARDLNAAMKMIAGTARSMGVAIQGKAPWNN